METLFEQRFKRNYETLKKIEFKKLQEIEEKNKYIYQGLSTKEIINAEFILIQECLSTEMKEKQNNINENDFINYNKLIKNIYSSINQLEENDLKIIITIIQLSLNITPSFPTTINELKYKPLCEILEQYTSKKQYKKEII